MKTPTIFGRKMVRVGKSEFCFAILDSRWRLLARIYVKKLGRGWEARISDRVILHNSSRSTAAAAAKFTEQYLTDLRATIQVLEQGGTK